MTKCPDVSWSTPGASPNIIHFDLMALYKTMTYNLLIYSETIIELPDSANHMDRTLCMPHHFGCR